MARQKPEITLGNVTDTTVTFKWAINGDNPDSYLITVQGAGIANDPGKPWQTVYSSKQGDPDYFTHLADSKTFTSLQPGSYYTLSVTASWNDGTNLSTDQTALTTGSSAGTTPSQPSQGGQDTGVPFPSDVVATAIDDSHISLTWKNNGTAVNIKVFFSTVSGLQEIIELGNGSSTSYTASNLQPSFPYLFQIQNFNSQGKYGFANSNPVTTKARPLARTHAGRFLLQSNHGSPGNFEVFLPTPTFAPEHFAAINQPGSTTWKYEEILPHIPAPALPVAEDSSRTRHFVGAATIAAEKPRDSNLPVCSGLTMIRSNFGGGNLEVVARFTPPAGQGADFLVTYFYEPTAGWSAAADLIVSGEHITGVTGTPSLIQSSNGSKGNFELLVPRGPEVLHLTRDNDTAGFPWRLADRLPAWSTSAPSVQTTAVPSGNSSPNQQIKELPTVAQGVTAMEAQFPRVTDVSCLQSDQNVGPGSFGALEIVACFRRPGSAPGNYLLYYYNNGNDESRGWSQPQAVSVGNYLVDKISGTHALVQSNYDQPGRLELLVPRGAAIAHYSRSNDSISSPASWEFRGDLPRPAWPRPAAPPPVSNDRQIIARRPSAVQPILRNETVFTGVSLIQTNDNQFVILYAVATVKTKASDTESHVALYAFNNGWHSPATLVKSNNPVLVNL